MLDLHNHLKRIVIERRQELSAIDRRNRAAALEAGSSLKALSSAVTEALGFGHICADLINYGDDPETQNPRDTIEKRVEVWLVLRGAGRMVRVARCKFTGEEWHAYGNNYATLGELIDTHYSDPQARARLADELLSLALGATP